MKIDTSNWQEFLLYDYFDIFPGKYHFSDEYEEGNIPYVSASNENNGIGQYINLEPDFEGNCIITGKVGCTAFYQPAPFCATSDVNIFKPKFEMTSNVGLFIVSIINFNENYKWAYGRQCRVGNSKKIKVKLPSKDNSPDWEWIEEFMGGLHIEPITTSVKSSKIPLTTEKWGEFQIGDLFDITRGKTLTSEDKEDYSGTIPCINGGSENNGFLCGLNEEIEKDSKAIKIKAPALSLSRVGNSGLTNVQYKDFYIADNAFGMKFKEEHSIYVYIFLSTILNKETFKYSYGRTIALSKYPNTIIKLPAKDNKPDWEWMENYIKSLPYSDRI